MKDNSQEKITAINPKDFTYTLPEEKIAKFPSEERGKSKMLHYTGQQISHYIFDEIPNLLPDSSLLVFNNTKVIPARIIFHKETGAAIEIFLLEPVQPSRVMSEAMNCKEKTTWKCMVGNAKKWKDNMVLTNQDTINHHQINVSVKLTDRQTQLVEFNWDNDAFTFAEIVDVLGKIPLPPYINRQIKEADATRYQTVYSKIEGAVAAPTAGLHFTDEIIARLKKKGIKTDEVTLHVSAGTFQPLKAENLEDHPMHSEQIIITKANVENIIAAEKVISVGTTSMRTLESTYWFGVKLLKEPDADFYIEKLFPYQNHTELPSKKESFTAILKYMNHKDVSYLVGDTQIFIFPGYTFRICNGLTTNFHLPGSTLILLVAAFIGSDWKKIYQEALDNNYKFLSYGDSSFLLRN